MIAFFLGGGFKGGGASLISFLIGARNWFFCPSTYVKSQQSKRLVDFNDQLSDMLNLMVNGLRAGYSTMQALEAVSRELPDPISSEFRRVIQEMQIGIPMEAALDNLLRRIPSENLDLLLRHKCATRGPVVIFPKFWAFHLFYYSRARENQRRNPCFDFASTRLWNFAFPLFHYV